MLESTHIQAPPGASDDSPSADARSWALLRSLAKSGSLPLLSLAIFLSCAIAASWLFGVDPFAVLEALVVGSVADAFAFSETLVKATPVLLCALASALPIRLGLISVGAEGQMIVGGIAGSAVILTLGDASGQWLFLAMLLGAAVGAGVFGAFAGFLRANLAVNETISTLLLNYMAPLLVNYLVYGPWKDPESLGWPSTVAFPEAAVPEPYFGTRVHFGLPLGLGLILLAWFVLRWTKLGYWLDLLKDAPGLALRAGLCFQRSTWIVMGIAAACAGLAGIVEVAAIEGRLQPGVGAGAGYSGFLVAWLARGELARVVPLALLVGALMAGGDNLQLFLDLPSAVSIVLQGLLFASVLAASGIVRRYQGAQSA